MVNEAYFSLLLSDSYLPGCLALAHALRASGTTRPLVLLALDSGLSDHTLGAVSAAFNLVLRVPPVHNPTPSNLSAIGRPDLALSFTKILLWNQTAFDRIIYLDADVLPLANLDHLFSTPGALAACPDAGWPDIFNSGVLVLSPSAKEFQGLYSLAETAVSFDGGDQGLLNTYFGSSWTRLPFLYNVTPTASYQYRPAFTHFSSDVKAVHFIGLPKPWQQNRPSPTESTGGSVDINSLLLNKWWSALDASPYAALAEQPKPEPEPEPEPVEAEVVEPPESELAEEEPVQPLSFSRLSEWNPTESAPPLGSDGEAATLPKYSHDNVWDAPYDKRTDPIFVAPPVAHVPDLHRAPPPREPSPPRGRHERISPPPIFPWEMHDLLQPVRMFPEDFIAEETPQFGSPAGYHIESSPTLEQFEDTDEIEVLLEHDLEEDDSGDVEGETEDAQEDGPEEAGAAEGEETEDLAEELAEDKQEETVVSQLFSPRQSPSKLSPVMASPTSGERRPSASSTAYNVWDRDQSIINYVSVVSTAYFGGRSSSSNSLPGVANPESTVSPAPLRRSSFYNGGANETDDDVPSPSGNAEGSPAVWDPMKQLDELAKLPSILLARHMETVAIDKDEKDKT